MNLIANTGIQFFTVQMEVDLNDKFREYFREWFDMEEEQLKLEIAHYFSQEEVWVKKHDLALLGYLTDGKVGGIDDNGIFKTYSWEDIKDDFYSEGYQPITPMETDSGEKDCFQISVNRVRWEKFENQWLPFPLFGIKPNKKSEFGPLNWCRLKLIPDNSDSNSNKKKYHILLAFDTRVVHENQGFEDEDLQEMPVFINEVKKDFTLCDNVFSLIDFCTRHTYTDTLTNTKREIDCEWVDDLLLKIFHNCPKEEFELKKLSKPRMSYMAQFIFINSYIKHLNIIPSISLYSDTTCESGVVDLLIDMGNSRTCAVLFDESKFSDVEPLGIQNFTEPIKNGVLNRHYDSFDMRLAFREASFGGSLKRGSNQFIYPSMVRLGVEANALIHKAVSLNTGVEKITTFSSPKRFLWDSKPQQKEWEFVTLNEESAKPVRIKGVSEQLNSDGTLNTDGISGIDKYYSRKALMTFGFLEILAQAKMHINSYSFRHKWGNESKTRRIGRIIVTCPTAMSRVEQIALRTCAEDAAIILDRFYKGTYYEELQVNKARSEVHVIPSVKNLKKAEERTEWIYDEATSSQFVYLFAEIIKRYRADIEPNHCKEYFDFYGKIRNDLENYDRKSITIGSVDIGAGTTDVMIASYKYDTMGQCKLTPVPLFWESFYIAGDDLLKNLVRKLIIEGQYAAIEKYLRTKGIGGIAEKIIGFFAPNNAQQDVTRRQIRSEFNIQVSIPVVTHFLELLSQNKIDKASLSYNDIFTDVKPTERLLEHFKSHFGFSIEDIQWNYDKEICSKIVESTFDSLIGKISSLLSYYGCDIVLLSGRPTSLKPIYDLFLKYYSVSPNRLISLNNYRIGTWYPFHDGKGFFKDAKSIVAVGAMIGNFASTRGSLDGFTLDLSELIKKMTPTTDYFSTSENNEAFITPDVNSAVIEVTHLPLRIWARQLPSPSYPTRPFYILDFNYEKITEKIINKNGYNKDNLPEINYAVIAEIERLRKLTPFTIRIVRNEYNEDKETLTVESFEDRESNSIPTNFLSLQVQSMSESENYWLDSGEFVNLNINH